MKVIFMYKTCLCGEKLFGCNNEVTAAAMSELNGAQLKIKSAIYN